MQRKFRRGDRVRPIKGGTYWVLRNVEGAALTATVTKLHRDRDGIDTIHVRFDDGQEWTQVVADYFEHATAEIIRLR